MKQFSRSDETVVFLALILSANEDGEVTITVSKLSEETKLTISVIVETLNSLASCQLLRYKLKEGELVINIYNMYIYTGKRKKETIALQDKALDERERLFEDRMKQCYPRVAKMPVRLHRYEWDGLIIKGYTKEQLMDILECMENWKPLLDKNVNAYKTLCNWLGRRYGEK